MRGELAVQMSGQAPGRAAAAKPPPAAADKIPKRKKPEAKTMRREIDDW